MIQAKTRWHKPDNTANLYVAVSNAQDPHVYRITVNMVDWVDETVLQRALDQTLPHFAAFNVRLHSGYFRSRFEMATAAAKVERENQRFCQYFDPEKGFLFRILYNCNCIHLEAFHALTDGMGAMQFLKAICYRYCQLKYPESFSKGELSVLYGLEGAGNTQDAFQKNYTPLKSRPSREPASYQLGGLPCDPNNLSAMTVVISLDSIKRESHQQNATVGEYLVAVIAERIAAVYKEQNKLNQPINIAVPVNLRPVFHTQTALNFFASITIVLEPALFQKEFAHVLHEVRKQFSEKNTRCAFENRIAVTVGGEKSLLAHIAPLSLKNWFLRLMYRHFNNSTVGFSNLGMIKIEDPFVPFMMGFRAFLTPTPREPLKLIVSSFRGELALTFSSVLKDDELVNSIVEVLRKKGIPARLERKT